MRFKAANCTELKCNGAKKVKFYPHDGYKTGGGWMAAATAIVKMGSRVVAEDEPGKSYVGNLKTGQVMLRESRGAFVFDVDSGKAGSASTFIGRG